MEELTDTRTDTGLTPSPAHSDASEQLILRRALLTAQKGSGWALGSSHSEIASDNVLGSYPRLTGLLQIRAALNRRVTRVLPG
jgi:hypothetical protein